MRKNLSYYLLLLFCVSGLFVSFLFKNSEGQALLAERLLPVHGYNFRDLGGMLPAAPDKLSFTVESL